ncbi:MAG: transglutaminase-like cysteine peptidase [Aurantimonas endophytica]|uniref:transglutaminase-like cysteine peptidase n=1 Tax=Aurantimonas endophytica TaxID=1522175 RepID=UPI0030021E1A
MSRLRAVGATLSLCLTLLAFPAAADTGAKYMPVGHATTQPIGHHLFCLENKDECRPVQSRGLVAPLKLDHELILAVAEINTRINARIEPRSDQDLYGTEERWAYPVDAGDCEDFALLKRRALHEIGIDLANLLLTVVRKRNGEGHAVLTLHTDRGDFILDNLNWRVVAWTDAPYRFVKRQSKSDPGTWLDIGVASDVVVGAVAQ